MKANDQGSSRDQLIAIPELKFRNTKPRRVTSEQEDKLLFVSATLLISMELEMEFLMFMATKQLKAFQDGIGALARARRAMNEHTRNEQVSKMGKSSATIGLLSLAYLLGVILQAGSTVPFCPDIILWFIFFTGLVGFIVGNLLQATNNPGFYINLATVTLFIAAIGAVFAVGMFAAASFASV